MLCASVPCGQQPHRCSLRRFAVIGAALIGEDGVRDVTIAPRNDAAAVDIGSKSWPFDIRLRPWVFRPHIGLLPLRYIAGGDVRPLQPTD